MYSDELDLHFYAIQGLFIEVQSLLNEGIDPDGNYCYDKTPLMLAAQYSHREIVELLINSGANIHCCDDKGWTLLHYASYGGSVEIVQCLVNKGVSLDVRNRSGQTPVMEAAQKLHVNVFELLVNSGADIYCCDNTGWTLLHYASCGGSMEIVQCLVNKGVPLDVKKSDGQTPLMWATVWSQKEIVKLLVNSGADIHCCDDNGWTVQHHAMSAGSVEIVKCLRNKGASFDVRNTRGQTPLMLANELSIITLLINWGVDIHCCDKYGWTVLHYILDEGSVETVKYLVDKGIAIDEKNSYSRTPLHLAIQDNSLDIADYLLKAGADCNLVDNEGKSPFNYLMKKKRPNVETIKLCIEKGAYVKSTDYKKLLKNPLLKTAVLEDVKLCSQALINKFNNKDLPLLYKGITSAQKLPNIDKMKIRNGSGMAMMVEQAVIHEIQAKGFCNLFKMVPSVLGILCVKSSIEKLIPAFNRAKPSDSQNSFKRLGSLNKQEYPYKKMRT